MTQTSWYGSSAIGYVCMASSVLLRQAVKHAALTHHCFQSARPGNELVKLVSGASRHCSQNLEMLPVGSIAWSCFNSGFEACKCGQVDEVCLRAERTREVV